MDLGKYFLDNKHFSNVDANNVPLTDPSAVTSTETMDITTRFFTACKVALDPGELCHSSWFTLQHSMSAIEIMDPKMDIRMLGSRRVVSTAEALATGVLPLAPFENKSELVGIMDELLASLVNWLTGDSLAQTVFICMYMHCTQLVRDAHLAAFCELLRRCVYQLRQFILAAGAFEEEDHYALTHGMPLKEPNFSFGDLDTHPGGVYLSKYSSVDLVTHAQRLLSECSSNTPDAAVEGMDYVRIRIEFLVHLLQLTDTLLAHVENLDDLVLKDSELEEFGCSSDRPGPEIGVTHFNQQPCESNDVEQFWTKLVSMSTECQSHLVTLNQLAAELLSTASFGLSPGPGKTSPKESFYGIPGFEPLLNQTNLPSYIPRFVVVHDRLAAFTYFCDLTDYMMRLTNTFHEVGIRHLNSPSASSLHLLWSLMRACGQTPCTYVTKIFGIPRDAQTSVPPSNSSSCLLSRTLSSFLYFVSMDRLHQSPEATTMHALFALRSWLLLEPSHFRTVLEGIVSDLSGLKDFFDVLGEQLSLIPRLYCLNRSRQRTALVQCLQKLPDILENCLRVEWIIGVELAKRLDPEAKDNRLDEPPKPVALQLTSLLCYYYYQLAWDYLISGFQLELYSPHEWIFMYTFIIQLLQNLHGLLERFITISLSNNTQSSKHDSLPHTLNGNTSCSQCVNNSSGAGDSTVHPHRSSGNRRKKNKKHSKSALANPPAKPTKLHEERPHNLSQSSALLKICGPCSETELVVLTVHRFLTAATMYALRALQLDGGGDPVLDTNVPNLRVGYGNPVVIYGRRLGIFLLTPNSPLVDIGGVQGAFDACKQYLTTDIFQSGNTSELYERAWRNFENARVRTQLALKRQQEDLNISMPGLDDGRNMLPTDFFQRFFNAPDRLSDLDRLANHNAIACRVLATCPDRRPKPDEAAQQRYTFLTSGPVRLEFDQLTSKTYPLIRLVSPLVSK
ncbi:N-alpha-acetyltransferase 35 NatC auxiliary subunit [Clonorchis sinensis]|uniref:Protein MAK10 homolog n=1 Tax=Clonorchis sinensis TaxID=79923 RepID=H2KPK7_CLOSI|nr:N-alpha-acetyltransferase 35 NatC auxiliary subunit [Clonorchis sinensis]